MKGAGDAQSNEQWARATAAYIQAYPDSQLADKAAVVFARLIIVVNLKVDLEHPIYGWATSDFNYYLLQYPALLYKCLDQVLRECEHLKNGRGTSEREIGLLSCGYSSVQRRAQPDIRLLEPTIDRLEKIDFYHVMAGISSIMRV